MNKFFAIPLSMGLLLSSTITIDAQAGQYSNLSSAERRPINGSSQIAQQRRVARQSVPALMRAIDQANVGAVRTLINRGANLSIRGTNQETVMIRAAKTGSLPIIEMLTGVGANIQARDAQGNTPLHVASQYGHAKVVRFLLLKKVRVDVSDGSGRTALIHAAHNGDIDVASLLLRAGAEIDAESFAGETALMHAVAADKSKMVHFLLESGASAQAKNESGKTSVDLARTRGNRNVLDVIAPEFSFASAKLKPGEVRDSTLAFVMQGNAYIKNAEKQSAKRKQALAKNKKRVAAKRRQVASIATPVKKTSNGIRTWSTVKKRSPKKTAYDLGAIAPAAGGQKIVKTAPTRGTFRRVAAPKPVPVVPVAELTGEAKYQKIQEMTNQITAKVDIRIAEAKRRVAAAKRQMELAEARMREAQRLEKYQHREASILKDHSADEVAYQQQEKIQKVRELTAQKNLIEKRKQHQLRVEGKARKKLAEMKAQQKEQMMKIAAQKAALRAEKRLKQARIEEQRAEEMQAAAAEKIRKAEELEDRVAFATKRAQKAKADALKAHQSVADAKKQALKDAENELRLQQREEAEVSARIQQLNDEFMEARKIAAQHRVDERVAEMRLAAAKRKAEEEKEALLQAEYQARLVAKEAEAHRKKDVRLVAERAAQSVATAMINAAQAEANARLAEAQIKAAEMQEAAKIIRAKLIFAKQQTEELARQRIKEAEAEATRRIAAAEAKIKQRELQLAEAIKRHEGLEEATRLAAAEMLEAEKNAAKHMAAKKLKVAEIAAVARLKSAKKFAQKREAEARVEAARIKAAAHKKAYIAAARIKSEAQKQARIAQATLRQADAYAKAEQMRVQTMEEEIDRLASYKLHMMKEDVEKLKESKLAEAAIEADRMKQAQLKIAKKQAQRLIAKTRLEGREASEVAYQTLALAQEEAKMMQASIAKARMQAEQQIALMLENAKREVTTLLAASQRASEVAQMVEPMALASQQVHIPTYSNDAASASTYDVWSPDEDIDIEDLAVADDVVDDGDDAIKAIEMAAMQAAERIKQARLKVAAANLSREILDEDLGAIAPAAGGERFVPAPKVVQRKAPQRKTGFLGRVINFFGDESEGDDARVQIAEAVRVPVVNHASQQYATVAKPEYNSSGQYWLKLGEFSSTANAIQHYNAVVHKYGMQQLSYKLLEPQGVNASGVSLKIGPVTGPQVVSKLCLKFRADHLGCSTITVQ